VRKIEIDDSMPQIVLVEDSVVFRVLVHCAALFPLAPYSPSIMPPRIFGEAVIEVSRKIFGPFPGLFLT